MHRKNVVQLASRRQSILHPDAVAYIICAGDENVHGLGLSALGKKQVSRLASYVASSDLQFGLAICPNVPLLAQTARAVLPRRSGTLWPEYAGCEFHQPRNEATSRALRDLVELARANRAIHLPHKENWPTTLYGRCTYQVRDTPNNFLEGFKEEIRKDTLALSGIRNASRIAIFSRGVVGNIIAEALFPQFADEIERIELNPCSILRLSAAGCEHFPLLF